MNRIVDRELYDTVLSLKSYAWWRIEDGLLDVLFEIHGLNDLITVQIQRDMWHRTQGPNPDEC